MVHPRPEDVNPVLTPAHLAAELAADRTRTLLAEAEADSLARVAVAARGRPRPRWWLGVPFRRTRLAPSEGPV